jgi:hypothetical protein
LLHDKFAKYWASIGKPPVEYRLRSLGSGWSLESGIPPFFNFCEYRIAGDNNWQIRRVWIDSDFKIKIESKIVTSDKWSIDDNPQWLHTMNYRIYGTNNIVFKPRHK